MNTIQTTLPTDTKQRKNLPLVRGVLDYFPAALAAVAGLSKAGNDKHNPGLELHWARGKSMDHADCIMRHLVERGTIDPEDGISHSVKVAWRALALLQEELEAQGAPLARGARTPDMDVLPAKCLCDRAKGECCTTCGVLVKDGELLDVPPVTFGGTQIRMKDLFNLSTGSVVELDQSLSDAVEIRANNCLIARGEVVAIDGNYGVRVLELVSGGAGGGKGILS